MSKRSADSSDDSDSNSQSGGEDNRSRKRRKVQFEPVRLVSVSGVNDLMDRQQKVQLIKLTELVRLKDKQLRDNENEKERLRQRQETDENTCCIVVRHWNAMDENLRNICRGFASTSNSFVEEPAAENFLAETIQMDEDQIETIYDKRIKSSLNIISQLQQEVVRRCAENRMFSKILSSYVDTQASTSEEHTDDQKMVQELVKKIDQLTDDNLRLQKEVRRYQSEMSRVRLEKAEQEDKLDRIMSKNEELQTELEDARFDKQKALKRAYKYECRLHSLAKEKSHEISKLVKTNGQVNGTTESAAAAVAANSTTVDSKELEKLKYERDEQAELANKRLQEIYEQNGKIQKLVAETTSLRIMAEKDVSETALSKDYNVLKSYFSAMKEELDRLGTELDEVNSDRESLRSQLLTVQSETKTEMDRTYRKIMETNDEVNSNNLQIRSEYDMLRMEFEQSLVQHTSSMSEAKQTDIKVIFNTLKIQNHSLKQDVAKFRKRWRDTVSSVAKTGNKLEEMRKKLENGVLIDLETGIKTYANGTASTLLETPAHDASERELRHKISQLIEKVMNLMAIINNGGGPLTAKDAEELNLLRRENEQMVKKLIFLGNENRTERQLIFENEANTQFKEKLDELDVLRKEKERMETDEKALTEELDSIGQALEDLQEQNGTLIAQKRDKEDQMLKMMNDRVASAQIHQKLKEEIMHLEQLKMGQQREIKVLQMEQQTTKDALAKAMETIEQKTAENSLHFRAMESAKKYVSELGLMRDDLLVKNEKLETQAKKLQEMLTSKSSQHENVLQKRRRADEEVGMLRKRLDRALKSEKLGSTDAVLNEENRQLKDYLTCPSCKVKRKDAILTKCFHVFCMDCLKKRYDTRQRKCPKCNANFGANDFHRIYLT